MSIQQVTERVIIKDCRGKGYEADWCVFVEREGDFINSGWKFFPTRGAAEKFAMHYCSETGAERNFTITQ